MRLDPPAAEGQGLNPLLEVTDMLIHPLLLYTGYVGFVVPYAFAIAAHALFHRRTAFLRRPGFWATTLLALAAYATYARFDHHVGWLRAQIAPELHAHAVRCAANLVPACWGALSVLVIGWLVGADSTEHYGLSLRGANLKGYAVALTLVLPFVVAASFLPSFLQTYPRYRPAPESGLSGWQLFSSFELCYGADFFFTELFFRGLLVVVLSRWLGIGAVMPMVVFYMTIHFGKPLGEALASVFGGWVLGLMALRTGSIWGGVLFHWGIRSVAAAPVSLLH